MQHCTNLLIHCDTNDEWDHVVKSVKDYLFGIAEEAKPEFYDSWLEDLEVDSAKHVIRVDSDVHAPFWDYESILNELIETIAVNNPKAVLVGGIDYSNDDFGPNEHGFSIENGKVFWDLPDADVDAIFEMYEEGMSPEEIAEELEIDIAQVKAIIETY